MVKSKLDIIMKALGQKSENEEGKDRKRNRIQINEEENEQENEVENMDIVTQQE